MTNTNRKVLEKLRRLERLAQSAATEGERAAAESARRRLVEGLEREGVHVAPELVAEVGGEVRPGPGDTQPLRHMGDGPTTEIAEDLVLEPKPLGGERPFEPSARTVVASPVEVAPYEAEGPVIEPPADLFPREPGDLSAPPPRPAPGEGSGRHRAPADYGPRGGQWAPEGSGPNHRAPEGFGSGRHRATEVSGAHHRAPEGSGSGRHRAPEGFGRPRGPEGSGSGAHHGAPEGSGSGAHRGAPEGSGSGAHHWGPEGSGSGRPRAPEGSGSGAEHGAPRGATPVSSRPAAASPTPSSGVPRTAPPRPPPPSATPMGALPDEIVVRSPVVADVDFDGWVEAEDLQRTASGTVVHTEPADPFVDKTPLVQGEASRTPPHGTPLPQTPAYGAAPLRGAEARFGGRTPPYGIPVPATVPPPRRRRAPKAPDGGGASSEGWRWTWKRILVAGVACVGALEVLAFFFTPDPNMMAARSRARAQRASQVDQSARSCIGGASDACADIGASISERLGENTSWGGKERGACASGDSAACARLGERYATEARRQRRSSRTLSEPESTKSEDVFREVACALGASACPE